jgi:hypothetical protein
MHVDSVYTLLGGFTAWKNEVLYPDLTDETTDEERIANKRRRMLSTFFGGEPGNNSVGRAQKGSSPKSQPHRRPIRPPTKLEKDKPQLRFVC